VSEEIPLDDAPPNDREVVSTRLIGAPRERVFAAYVDPEKLRRWWGPKGFTNVFHECDLRPGGDWRFTMIGPDGAEYKNHSVFAEIVPNERFVYEHRSGPVYRGDVTFADEGGKTRLTFRMTFDSPTFLERMREVLLVANQQNFDRLETVLGLRAAEG
jgi:uncharacterized protein YndB with AHSA1/START domain